MKSSIAVAATLALSAEAQFSNGWQNQPTKYQLTQEKYRCGCPIPKPIISSCQAALPPAQTGCGCQPAACNPAPAKQRVPTKVLALVCHDVTTWKTEMEDVPQKAQRQKRVKKSKPTMRSKTTYKDVQAIRYRRTMVPSEEPTFTMRQVPKTTYKTVTKQVRVVAQPETRVDCCGNTTALPQSPCSCAAPPKYTTKTITSQVPVTTMVPEKVPGTKRVMVRKDVPYEVTVKQAVITNEPSTEDYWETTMEEYFITKKVRKEIPIVTRRCTDASGKIITTIKEVPLHHSGPAPNRQSMEGQMSVNNSDDGVEKSAPTCGGEGQDECAGEVPAESEQAVVEGSVTTCGGPDQAPCDVPSSDFQRASLVNAPLDRTLGDQLVQIGVVDPRRSGNWANQGRGGNMMQGQWGGPPLNGANWNRQRQMPQQWGPAPQQQQQNCQPGWNC